MNIDTSIGLYNRAVHLMPGGVNSPVRAFRSVGGTPLFMERGEGPYLFDADSNRYIDYCMSWGPLILGHGDRDVISAITEAALKGTSFGTPNKFEVEIAEMVIDRFPSIEKIRFVNSGTEATMSAIRLARGYTGKEKIIKFDGCYHGHGDHLLVAGGSGLATFSNPDSDGVTENTARDTIVAHFNNVEKIKTIIDENSGNIAAIIMEPVPCNYGLIPPHDSFLQKVREICTMNDILLIFDEVITGLRLAPGGAQEYFNVLPDITTLGKIIGGGLPVGAYGASKEIMAKVSPDGPVYQAGTLSGNPLAMAAGIATLNKLGSAEPYKLLKNKSETLKSLMKPVLEKYSGRVKLLQLESIFALYFTDRDEIISLDDVQSCDMKTFGRFHSEMLQRGIYFSPSGFEVGFLSTVHSDSDLKETVDKIEKSLETVFT